MIMLIVPFVARIQPFFSYLTRYNNIDDSSDHTRILHSYLRNTYVYCTVIFFIYGLFAALVPPRYRTFRLDDLRIQHPFAKVETVPVPLLFLSAGGIPLLIVCVRLILSKASLVKVHVTLSTLILAYINTLFFTEIIKDAVARPRPDFISRCQPAEGTPSHDPVNDKVCTQSHQHMLVDGWRSFPSGHSSFACCGFMILSLFIASETGAFNSRSGLGRKLLAFSPLLGALLIAISRLVDYRHHLYDVATGLVLGGFFACHAWRRSFPALSSTYCSIPLIMGRIEGSSMDEEIVLRALV